MSHSIGIPGFVNERKQDIAKVSSLKRAISALGAERNKRDRISMYRTRSYLPYRMSRSVKQRHKRGPALFSTVSARPKILYRRHLRLPQLLHNTFTRFGSQSSPDAKTEKNAEREKFKTETIEEYASCLDEGAPTIHGRGSFRKLRLNTHLWHTKRFKVLLQDGWYAPIKHISRGLKAVDSLYDKSVIQDVSHYTALATGSSPQVGSILVTGGVNDINALFGQFTDPLESLIYVDEEEVQAVTEAFEKEVIFHARRRFPAECIGPVMLLVTPSAGGARPHLAQVRVSCHPAIASDVYQALRGSDDNTAVSVDSALQSEEAPETHGSVQLERARFNRLRLRGPDASTALLSILHGPLAPPGIELGAENAAKIAFLRAALEVRDLSKHFEDGDVISLHLGDPRLNPPVRGGKGKVSDKDKPKLSQTELVAALKLRPSVLAHESPLFDGSADFSFESEHVFNEAKHSAKVRKWESLFKTTTPFGAEASSAAALTSISSALEGAAANATGRVVSSNILPVLLIRKATPFRCFRIQKHRLSGWDIVLPAAWGSLVFRHLQQKGGAAAVGAEEMDFLLAKSGIPTFPRDFPDTPAGRVYWSVHQENQRDINEKRPPLKQIETHALGSLLETIAGPAALRAEEGCTSTADLTSTLIVRGESYLRDFLPPPFENLDKSELQETSRLSTSCAGWASSHIPRLPALPRLMFLQVLLIPTSRGLILDLAELVCPCQEDVAQFVRHKLATQTKRTAARGKSTELREDHVAVKGVYRRDSASKEGITGVSAGVVVEDLPKEWEGVQLSRVPRPTRADANPSEKEETTNGAVPSSTKKVCKAKTRAAEILFDIGAEQGRKVIGTVTTGQREHLNNSHFAVGLCNVNALNELFSASYGRYMHPQAHFLVLYRNARSDHLRPAIFQIV